MSSAQQDFPADTWTLDRQPVVAAIETDRFCDRCGYNLMGQVVRRDARTELLLSRCPECGRIHAVRDTATVGRVWLQRLGMLLLAAWIAGVVFVGVLLTTAQGIATWQPLLELTTLRQMTDEIQLEPRYRTWRTQRVPRDQVPDYRERMAGYLSLSAASGFALALLLVIALPHWRRWGYYGAVVLAELLPALFVWWLLSREAPHLRAWAGPYVIGQALAHLGGATIGILLGRPLARVLVRLALPPRPRQVLAYLWHVDGRRLPGAEGGSRTAPRTPSRNELDVHGHTRT